jgi:hypothetical protein
MQDFSFSFPIVKVDREKRLIRGVGSSEVLDTQGEVLSYDGTKAAFAEWTDGVPLREMHQPKASGRAIGYEFDDQNRQVIVTAFVSKGAQDVWEKVLDGTLRMLSVGGKRIVSTIKRAADLPRRVFALAKTIPDTVRWTEKWQLAEISLVDCGANPACGFEIIRSATGLQFCKRTSATPAPLPAQFAVVVRDVFGSLQGQFASLRHAAEDMEDHAAYLESEFDDVNRRIAHLEAQEPATKPSPAKVATPTMSKRQIREELGKLPPGDPRREALEIQLLK